MAVYPLGRRAISLAGYHPPWCSCATSRAVIGHGKPIRSGFRPQYPTSRRFEPDCQLKEQHSTLTSHPSRRRDLSRQPPGCRFEPGTDVRRARVEGVASCLRGIRVHQMTAEKEMTQPKCRHCRQPIGSDDTVMFDGDQLVSCWPGPTGFRTSLQLPAEVRQRVREARAAALRLVKHDRGLSEARGAGDDRYAPRDDASNVGGPMMCS